MRIEYDFDEYTLECMEEMMKVLLGHFNIKHRYINEPQPEYIDGTINNIAVCNEVRESIKDQQKDFKVMKEIKGFISHISSKLNSESDCNKGD